MSNNLIGGIIVLGCFLYVFFIHKPLSEKFGFVKESLFLAATMILAFVAVLCVLTIRSAGFDIAIVIISVPFLFGAYVLFKLSLGFPENKDVFKLSGRR